MTRTRVISRRAAAGLALVRVCPAWEDFGVHREEAISKRAGRATLYNGRCTMVRGCTSVIMASKRTADFANLMLTKTGERKGYERGRSLA